MIDLEKVDNAYEAVDKKLGQVIEDLELNYFEIIHILAMLECKVKEQNISAYLLETVTRFAKEQNEQDAGV